MHICKCWIIFLMCFWLFINLHIFVHVTTMSTYLSIYLYNWELVSPSSLLQNNGLYTVRNTAVRCILRGFLNLIFIRRIKMYQLLRVTKMNVSNQNKCMYQNWYFIGFNKSVDTKMYLLNVWTKIGEVKMGALKWLQPYVIGNKLLQTCVQKNLINN